LPPLVQVKRQTAFRLFVQGHFNHDLPWLLLLLRRRRLWRGVHHRLLLLGI
jgi:hypothetical protein